MREFKDDRLLSLLTELDTLANSHRMEAYGIKGSMEFQRDARIRHDAKADAYQFAKRRIEKIFAIKLPTDHPSPAEDKE